jgi:hypothetical protein
VAVIFKLIGYLFIYIQVIKFYTDTEKYIEILLFNLIITKLKNLKGFLFVASFYSIRILLM